MSSANEEILKGISGSGVSDVYAMYKMGERTEPCGTPLRSGVFGPTCEPTLMAAVRPFRNPDSNRARTVRTFNYSSR